MLIYLSGSIVTHRHPMLGFMVTPQMGQAAPAGEWWAADNGRFAAPEKYTDVGYVRWLLARDKTRALFATAPDVLGDHSATVDLSRPLFPYIRRAGYRPAFVAQDGWREETTPWDEFDILFLGGTTDFKLGLGLRAARIANNRRKWVHMGRANSLKRLLLARDAGCHSADGTFLKYGPDKNWPRMLKWFAGLTIRNTSG